MARYPVLQPNKKIAVWSTIVDDFVGVDLNQREAVDVLQSWYSRTPRSELSKAVKSVAHGKIPEKWEHIRDWEWLLTWTIALHGDDDRKFNLINHAINATPQNMMDRVWIEVERMRAEWKAESESES